jgi:hypothetical protein
MTRKAGLTEKLLCISQEAAGIKLSDLNYTQRLIDVRSNLGFYRLHYRRST